MHRLAEASFMLYSQRELFTVPLGGGIQHPKSCNFCGRTGGSQDTCWYAEFDASFYISQVLTGSCAFSGETTSSNVKVQVGSFNFLREIEADKAEVGLVGQASSFRFFFSWVSGCSSVRFFKGKLSMYKKWPCIRQCSSTSCPKSFPAGSPSANSSCAAAGAKHPISRARLAGKFKCWTVRGSDHGGRCCILMMKMAGTGEVLGIANQLHAVRWPRTKC